MDSITLSISSPPSVVFVCSGDGFHNIINIITIYCVFVCSGDGFQLLRDPADIVWPGGGTVTPRSQPECGWDDELCVAKGNS